MAEFRQEALDMAAPLMQDARRRLERRFGDGVDEWWAGLPAVVAGYVERWGLTFEDPASTGETALVLRCITREGAVGFLKLSPDPDLSSAEADALAHWAATGRVPVVWQSDPDRGALLLEGLPGPLLSAVPGSVPVGDLGALIRDLHEVPWTNRTYPALLERVDFLYGLWDRRLASDPDAAALVIKRRWEAGRALARELAVLGPPVLLHGDLHPANVLNPPEPGGLVAIDPRPCVGDGGFDLIDWVLWGTDDPGEWRSRCAELSAAVGYDADRVWAWCAAFAAMLAAIESGRGGGAARVSALLGIAA